MSEEVYQGIDTLVAWQRARALMRFVHQEVAPLLPVEEKWDLTSQIRRSSKSVMANIAEGHGRYYYQENIRFCYLARGSLTETYSHLVTANDLGYISTELFTRGKQLVDETRRPLHGYIAHLKSSKTGGDLPGGRIKEIAPEYLVDSEPTDDDSLPITHHPSPITK